MNTESMFYRLKRVLLFKRLDFFLEQKKLTIKSKIDFILILLFKR